jgi:hypothetical protein
MAHSLTTRRVRPTLQTLDDRIVPATLVDLTSVGSEGTANGAIFRQYEATVDDTSVPERFLKVRDNGVEQGYNTAARQRRGDGNADALFARAIRLGAVPQVEVDGETYRAFFLDVRQRDGSSLISLDELRIYAHQTRNLTGYNANTLTLGGQAAIWDLDAVEDTFIRLDAAHNADVGRGDAFILIPDSVFAGWTDDNFVYLFSKFGVNNRANGGAEVWGLKVPPQDDPPPPSEGTASLSGKVFVDLNFDGVFNVDDGDYVPVDPVTLILSWEDEAGLHSIETVTDENGNYSFTNLIAEEYTITKITPVGFLDGIAYPGSLGGSEGPNSILAIPVQDNDVGINYNFGLEEDSAG